MNTMKSFCKLGKGLFYPEASAEHSFKMEDKLQEEKKIHER